MNKRSAVLNITSQIIYTVIGITLNITWLIWLLWRFIPRDIFIYVSVFLLISTWILSFGILWLSPIACIALLKADITYKKQNNLTVKSIERTD